MAEILGVQTLNSVLIISTDTDPSLGLGTVAPMGSIAISIDGSGIFFKQSATDTDWSKTPLQKNVQLVDSPTISVNAAAGSEFDVTLGGNRTLENPTNPTDGKKIVFRVKQDATGGRTLTLDTAYKLGTDITALNLSTSPNATDYIGFIYDSSISKWCLVSLIRGF